MTELALELKGVIESLACPEHNTHPVVVIDGEKIILECCCPKCKAQCHYLIKKMSTLKLEDKQDRDIHS